MKVLYVTNSVGMGGDSVALINILEYLTKDNVTPISDLSCRRNFL